MGQRALNDDEFEDLLNGGSNHSSDYVQPTWNISRDGGLRDTQYVPTFEESKRGEDDEDGDGEIFKVHHDQNYRGRGGKRNKMNTIKEEQEEDRKSDGSDTAYFSPDADINERDEDSEEEDETYEERMRRLELDIDDEDNVPYDAEDQLRKEQEEFGDSGEEEDEDEEEVASMSMTMMDRKKRELEKELRESRHRMAELEAKIQNKVKEGTQITKSTAVFE